MRVPAGTGTDDLGNEVLVLRGLRASTVHKEVTLRAIGESGMASAAVSMPAFSTLRKRIMSCFRHIAEVFTHTRIISNLALASQNQFVFQ